MTRLNWLFLVLFFVTVPQFGFAQKVASSDNMQIKPKHSPHKASIYSAILPGLGQAYNKKYWKIPIVYAGFGTISYFAITNRKEYLLAKEAYVYVSNGEEYEIDNKYVGVYTASDLIEIKDYYRRNTELSWIIMSLWYALNIIDATVDAHFFDYDISDNLSLQLQPGINSGQLPWPTEIKQQPIATGLTIRLNF